MFALNVYYFYIISLLIKPYFSLQTWPKIYGFSSAIKKFQNHNRFSLHSQNIIDFAAEFYEAITRSCAFDCSFSHNLIIIDTAIDQIITA